VTVQLDEPAAYYAGVTVDVSAAGTTATLGQDYSVPGAEGNSVSLYFTEGATTQSFQVTVLPDDLTESSENVVLAISGCYQYVDGDYYGDCDGGVGSSATLTIVGTQPAPAPAPQPTGTLGGLSGLTPNEREIATTLDDLCPQLDAASETRFLSAGERDLLNQCQVLQESVSSNPGAAVQGIVALTPDQASVPRKMATQLGGAQLDNIEARLQALRRGVRGIDLKNLSFNVDGQRLSGTTLAGMVEQGDASGGGASADDAYQFERLGIFVNGNVDWGDKDSTSNEEGFDFTTLGISAGVDYRFLDGLVLGAALGFGNSDANIDSNGGDLNADAWTALLYGTYYATEHFYLEGSVSYGWGSYDQTRNIDYSLLGGLRQAKADYDSTQYAFLFGAGYDFIVGSGILDTYGRLRYAEVDLDGYTEKGASGLDLDIGSQEATSFQSVLGVNYTRSISLTKVVLVPQGWIEWTHEFDSGDDDVTGVFANDPNRIPFALATDALDSNFFRVGVGLGAQFGEGRTAFVTYEAAIGMNNYTEQTANLGLRLDF